MTDLAKALQRPSIDAYTQACEAFGVDPAAFLCDDVLEAQFRFGVLAIRGALAAGPHALPGSRGVEWPD